MIFDQQSSAFVGEMIPSPDWVFGNNPKSPDDVKESESIKGQGTTGSKTIRIKGSSDTNKKWNNN